MLEHVIYLEAFRTFATLKFLLLRCGAILFERTSYFQYFLNVFVHILTWILSLIHSLSLTHTLILSLPLPLSFISLSLFHIHTYTHSHTPYTHWFSLSHTNTLTRTHTLILTLTLLLSLSHKHIVFTPSLISFLVHTPSLLLISSFFLSSFSFTHTFSTPPNLSFFLSF